MELNIAFFRATIISRYFLQANCAFLLLKLTVVKVNGMNNDGKACASTRNVSNQSYSLLGSIYLKNRIKKNMRANEYHVSMNIFFNHFYIFEKVTKNCIVSINLTPFMREFYHRNNGLHDFLFISLNAVKNTSLRKMKSKKTFFWLIYIVAVVVLVRCKEFAWWFFMTMSMRVCACIGAPPARKTFFWHSTNRLSMCKPECTVHVVFICCCYCCALSHCFPTILFFLLNYGWFSLVTILLHSKK